MGSHVMRSGKYKMKANCYSVSPDSLLSTKIEIVSISSLFTRHEGKPESKLCRIDRERLWSGKVAGHKHHPNTRPEIDTRIHGNFVVLGNSEFL